MSIAKKPMRKCIGCGKSFPKDELIRIASNKGELTVDLAAIADGRGVYICKNHDCLKKAIKRKAFVRSCKSELTEEQVELLKEEIAKYEKSK